MNLKEFLAMDGAVEDDSLYARLVKAAKGKINRDNTGRGGNTPKNQSLEQHDKRFHPQGYEKGDTCKFREKLGEESSPDDLSEKNTDLDVNNSGSNGDDLYAKVYGMSEYEDDLDSFEYDIKKIPNGATKESLGITDPSVQGVVGKYVGESGSIDDANYFLRHDISNIVHNTNHAYKDQGLELGVVSGKDGTYLVLKKASTAANSDVTKSGRKGLTYTATKCNSQGEFDDLMRGAFMRYGDDEFWMEDVSEDEPFFKKMEELNPEYMDAWKDYQAKRNGAKSKWSRNTPAQKYIDSVNKRYSYPSQSSGSASSSENAQGDEKTKEMYLEAKKDFKNVASEFSRKGFKGIRHEKHPEVIKAASDFLTRIGLDPNGKDLQKDHDFSNNLDAMAFMLTDAALTDEFEKEYLHEIQDLIRSGIAKGKGAK